jgi:hypothetical protein
MAKNQDVSENESKPQGNIVEGGDRDQPDTRTYADISREITDAHQNPQRREQLKHTDPHVDEKYGGVSSNQLYELIMRAPSNKGDEAVSAMNEIVGRTDRFALHLDESVSRVQNVQNALRQGMTLDANGMPDRNITNEDRIKYHEESFGNLLNLRAPGAIREMLVVEAMRLGRGDQASQLYIDSLRVKENLPNQVFEEQIRLLASDEKRFDDQNDRLKIHRAAEELIGGRDGTDTRYLSDGLAGIRNDNPDRVSVHDFAKVANDLFDKADIDKNGFLNIYELKNAYFFENSIVGKDKDAISTMHANLDMFQQLSNDEWGTENDGITRKDLDAFGKIETLNFERLHALKEARNHLIFGGNLINADKDANGFLSSRELQSVINDSNLTDGQRSSYFDLKGVVDGLPSGAKGIGVAELLKPIDERVLKVNYGLYKDYLDRNFIRSIDAPR